MNTLQKKIISVLLICALFVAGIVVVKKGSQAKEEATGQKTEQQSAGLNAGVTSELMAALSDGQSTELVAGGQMAEDAEATEAQMAEEAETTETQMAEEVETTEVQTSEQVAVAALPEYTVDVSEKTKKSYEKAKTDLTFWYEDESYQAFFEAAALYYYEETGKKVAVQCQDTVDFMGDVYDKTMQDEAFPDVYLISGDNLEEAYLYGLVSVNEKGLDEVNVAKNAKTASTYGDKLLGYPLSYNTTVFIFQTDYFGEAPESLQAIIDYSNENEPAENVEYLLEWDVNDPFYDFPFVSNSVTFEKNEANSMNVVYDEELYQQDLEYFDGILASFSVDVTTVSEKEIVENFLAGRTLSAIIDTDSLYKLDNYDYSLMLMPSLNDTLATKSCASTDMLVVNDYSKNRDEASEFAYFATVTMASELYPLTGHFSVIPSETPSWVEQVSNEAYESAVLMPDSQDAKDFWVKLEETISKYF